MNHCFKIRHYQQNVPQHYYLLDTLVIEIYFEVMRTLLALVVIILFTLYTVACVQMQLQRSFSTTV